MIPDYLLNTITTGDARELAAQIPDESVDLIFTDPPYPAEYLPLYDWLSETAARVLKPSAPCFAYAGQSYLPKVLSLMGEHLNYIWMAGVGHSQRQIVWQRRVIVGWKPILVFAKGATSLTGDLLRDFVWPNSADKRYHHWGQNEIEASQYISHHSTPGSIVFDPFSGGGTTAAVCKTLGRQYIGFEIDPSTAETARERVRNTMPSLFEAPPVQMELVA